MKHVKHWQDPLNAGLGVWLFLSPWLVGFQDQATPTMNAVAAGILLGAAALGATFVPRAWEEWTEGALGLWMVVSPWVLGFETMRAPMMNALVTGIAVMGLALWVLVTDKDYVLWRKPAH
ncbi:SPW repeat protein [Variovorax sp. J22R133]|uniref:SPW repeat protein n=1 Tax=Variovorax brevis TaxID=3053503 RepID=UPI002574D11B|nr:SPW repeat protein [Variovorax sp. J22R133]MDM0118098.1 SPW repeat protein [Variovorax sp. J22R133]